MSKLKKIKVRLIIIFIYFVVLGILALPTFSFTLAGREIFVNGGNFFNIGINANFPSLSRGKEVFPSIRHTARIVFSESENSPLTIDQKKAETGTILSIIRDRLEYAQIEDIETSAKEDTSGDFYIELTIPDNYQMQEEYVRRILNSGEVSFYTEQGEEGLVNFMEGADYDIENITIARNFVVEIDEQNGGIPVTLPHLYMTLNGPIYDTIGYVQPLSYSVVESGLQTVSKMRIGDLNYDLHADQAENFAEQKHIRALLNQVEYFVFTDQDIENFLRLTQSYFQSDELDHILEYSNDSTKVIEARYNSEGGALIAISFLSGITMIVVLSMRGESRRSKFLFAITLVSTLLSAIVILKILKYSISSAFVFSFIIIIPLISILIENLIRNSLDDSDRSNTRKIFLAFAPLFIYITLTLLNQFDLLTFGASALVPMVIMISSIFYIFYNYVRHKAGYVNNLIISLTIILGFASTLNFHVELIHNLLLVSIIMLSALSINLNLVYREIHKTIIK